MEIRVTNAAKAMTNQAMMMMTGERCITQISYRGLFTTQKIMMTEMAVPNVETY